MTEPAVLRCGACGATWRVSSVGDGGDDFVMEILADPDGGGCDHPGLPVTGPPDRITLDGNGDESEHP